MLQSLICCAKASFGSVRSAPHTFRRAQKGLFGGKVKQYGNNVPESHQKTRRSWLPNIQQKALYSAALDRIVRIKVTAAAVRDIDKVGGLDEYLFKRGVQDDIGKIGLKLQEQIRQARRATVRAAARNTAAAAALAKKETLSTA